MKPLRIATALMLVFALSTAVSAAERVRVAVLPVKVVVKEQPVAFDSAHYVITELVNGISKLERFNVLSATDVQQALDDAKFKPEEVIAANGAEIAKALKVRVLIFPQVDALNFSQETEDLVLVKRETVVASATVRGTLYDAETKQTQAMGPYSQEENKVASQDEMKDFTPAGKGTRKMIERCFDEANKQLRARLYKLYPLCGKVIAVLGDVITIDIGSAMGVEAGQKYFVRGPVEKENAVTGQKEKVEAEIAGIVVDSADENSSKCKLAKGDKAPPVGSYVERDFRN
jgi:ribonucleotide monophosphatase NagD (HAD superfamily)